jgi:hypothetical protein
MPEGLARVIEVYEPSITGVSLPASNCSFRGVHVC